MIGEAIGGFDSSKMRDGGDESGYVIGVWCQPSTAVRFKMRKESGGAECPEYDEHGYPVTLPRATKTIFRVVEAGQFEHKPGVLLQDVIASTAKRFKAWGVATIACDEFESTNVVSTFTQ